MCAGVTDGDCAEADAAECMQVFLRHRFQVVDDEERAGHVDHRVVINSLQVRHASAVVTERVTSTNALSK